MEYIIQPLFDFLAWLIRTSWQAAVLIILVMAIQMIFRRRLTARWRYILWLLVVARMLLPVSPASKLSIYNLQRLAPEAAIAGLAYMPVADLIKPHAVEIKSHPAVPAAASRPAQKAGKRYVAASIPVALAIGWLLGVAGLLIRVLWENYRFSLPVIRKRPVTDPGLLNLLEDCKAEMKVHTPVQLIITPRVNSPVLLGFIRPRLLLPENVTASLSLQELHYIFLHEIAHVKRLDIPVNWLMTILQILHWFNPLVWLAFARMRIDREQACDALVLARQRLSYQPVHQEGGINEEKIRYGEVIIKLLNNITQTASLPSFAGILEGKSQMKKRIEMIAQFSSKSYQWSALAVILMAGLTLVCFTRAQDSAVPGAQNKAALDKNGAGDGTTLPVTPGGKHVRVKATFSMFQAKYRGGNWNANPSAIINLVTQLNKWANNRIKPALPTEIDIGSDQMFILKPPFLYLGGDGDFQFSEKEAQNLKKYLELGGAIWADSASDAFDAAFRREIKRILPDSDFAPVEAGEFSDVFFDNARAPQEPVEIIKGNKEVSVLYTHGCANLWAYRLTEQGTVDRNAILVTLDPNIQDEVVLNAYKYGINCVVYFLTRYQHLVKSRPEGVK